MNETTNSPLTLRDWVVMALLSLLTIAVIGGSLEAGSRLLYQESRTSTLSCLVVGDPSTGVHAIPNSRCVQKSSESTLVHYEFNSCGHRAGMPCGSKNAGTLRIVMIGSSFNYGMHVERDQSFAARLPGLLSAGSGQKIELYNEAMQWGFPRSVTLRLGEVIAAQPDVILWPLTPADIEAVDQANPYVPPPIVNDVAASGSAWHRLTAAWQSKSAADFFGKAWNRVASRINDTDGMFLLKHIAYGSQSEYVKQYLMKNDGIDYLRSPTTAGFEDHLALFSQYFQAVQHQADTIGAVVVVTVLPERAQAAMISMHQWPPGFDPYLLGNEIRTIVEANKGVYVDVLQDFRAIPNPEQYYLRIDGHPDAEGHAVIAGLLANSLIRSGVIKANAPKTIPRT